MSQDKTLVYRKQEAGMKRYTAILLAMLLLSSCTGPAPEESETAQTQAAETPETEEPAETEEEIDFSTLPFLERIRYSANQVEDNLPDKSFDGRSALVRHQNSSYYIEEQNGEALNDSIYNQYLTIEDRFDVKIVFEESVSADIYEWTADMQKLAMSGDHYADLVECWNNRTAELVSQGYYTDLSGSEYIDIKKPWYFGNEIEMYSYGGRYYAITGFMNTPKVFGAMTSVFYNKNIGTDYNFENLYDVVREGRWTLDYILGITSSMLKDANGNGRPDKDDVFALNYSVAGSWLNTPATMEIPQIDKDENGDLVFTVFSNPEKAQPIWDGMRDLTYAKNFGSYSSSDWGIESFLAGNALVAYDMLGSLSALRTVEFDYGVLPPWKADEAQENYYTSYLPCPWLIPTSVPDLEFAEIMMTAFAAEGYKQVLPVCYESTFKNKYAVDEDTGEMLDLMMKNVRADGSLMFGDAGYIYAMWNYNTSRVGFGAYWQKKRSAMEARMDEILSALESIQ